METLEIIIVTLLAILLWVIICFITWALLRQVHTATKQVTTINIGTLVDNIKISELELSSLDLDKTFDQHLRHVVNM